MTWRIANIMISVVAIHKIWNMTYPIFAKFFEAIPRALAGAHIKLQHAAPAQQSAIPKHDPKHIYLILKI